MSALLSLQNVSAGYGSKIVVSGINIELDKGELCALLGLNGCGKTTLIKTICGLLPLKSGSCHVQGTDCSGFHEKKLAQHISYIPQRHSKLIGVTVLDAVMMGYYPHLGLLEFPTAAQKITAYEALEKMGIGNLAAEDFSRLSEGQKQLVILTRTLIQNTPVMLMDEPDSALDFLNRNMIMTKFRELVKNEGKAVLVSLHDPNLALAFCDRLILMRDGKIVSIISPRDMNMADIEKSLFAIYDGITLREYDGQYVVVFSSRVNVS
jgi:iron complex transport system ATP-binding protein